jgi:hypothetical protein
MHEALRCASCAHWEPLKAKSHGVQWGDCPRLVDVLAIDLLVDDVVIADPQIDSIASPESFGCTEWARSGD